MFWLDTGLCESYNCGLIKHIRRKSEMSKKIVDAFFWPFLFVSVLIHELGHLVAALMMRARVHDVFIYVPRVDRRFNLGFPITVTDSDEYRVIARHGFVLYDRTYDWRDFPIVLGGLVFTFLAAAGAVSLGISAPHPLVFIAAVIMFVVNAYLFVINLRPQTGSDGDHMLALLRGESLS